MKRRTKPFISIVTITFNCINDLRKTVLSINSQTYTNYEHIVIDGNSQDLTKEYLSSINKKNFVFISENDTGIYDAMNKGLNLVNGDFVLMLNSGDYFFNDNSLLSFVNEIYDLDQIYYAKAFVFNTDGFMYSKPQNLKLDLSKIKNFPIHQSVLIPRKYFRFRYNEIYSIVGDTEYLIRLFKLQEPIFVDVKFVSFNLGGISSHQKNIKQLRRYIFELNAVIRIHENNSKIQLYVKNLLIVIKFIVLNSIFRKFYYKLIKFLHERD